MHVFGCEVDRRDGVVAADANEVETLPLPPQSPVPGKDVLAHPHDRADLESDQAGFLEQLASQRHLVALVPFDAAAWGRPPHVAVCRVLEPHQQHPLRLVHDDRPHRVAWHRLDPLPQRPKPAESLGEGHRGVGGRGRGEDEEPGRGERSQLGPEIGTLAERAPVGLLADERDRARAQVASNPLQPAGVEVGAAQVPRAGSRPVRGVRDAEAEREQLELLGRVEETRCEARLMEQPPEVVARVREVRRRGSRHAARVDPAKNAGKARREDVGDGDATRRGFGHAADSVADGSSTSTCRPTTSEAAGSAGPAAAPRTAAARSSSHTDGCSCGLLPLRIVALLRQLEKACDGDSLAAILYLPGKEDADLVGAEPAVAAGIAFGLRQRPEPHCAAL